MRHFLAAVFAWALVAGPVQADPIEDVITSQLDAFNARNTERAFSFASPMIKRLFGTPDNFGGMVARGYPMVWDNDFVRFLDRAERGDSRLPAGPCGRRSRGSPYVCLGIQDD